MAIGYSHREGIDYNETFAPVVRHESLRLLFAYAASEGLVMQRMDVTTAFLYADIDGEVFLEMPECMEWPPGDKVLLFLKCIYGLKQASRLWNIHIDAVLGKINFMRLTADFREYVIVRGGWKRRP